MTKGRIALLFIAAMVFLAVGFVIGQIVQAAGTIPGTAGDPLVAQSYVEKVVEKTVSDLQSKLDEMESKVAALEAKIESLESGSGKSTSSGSSGSSGSSTGKSSGNNSSSNNSGSKNSGSSSKEPEKEPEKSDSQGKTGTVSGSSANVRTGPGTTYDKITTLVQGDTVKIISEENSWYKVTLSDGQEGWIANWLLEVK
jgi:cobalamin biosynthesis Mg chelatase CobN